jgi:hypothetical protein
VPTGFHSLAKAGQKGPAWPACTSNLEPNEQQKRPSLISKVTARPSARSVSEPTPPARRFYQLPQSKAERGMAEIINAIPALPFVQNDSGEFREAREPSSSAQRARYSHHGSPSVIGKGHVQ